MNIKKRYLLPLSFLILLGASFIAPIFFNIVFFLSMPSMLLVNPLSEALGGPTDTTYLVFLGNIVFFFVLGYIWDKIADKFGSKDKPN
jgi:MFS family permease